MSTITRESITENFSFQPDSLTRQKKIKVLFVLRMLGYGGAERQVVELCRGLNKNIFDVAVVLFYYDEGFLFELKATGVAIQILATKATYKRTALFRLMRLMRQEKYDIVHTFLPIANFIGGLAARLTCRAVVIGSLRVANPFSWRDPFCLMDYCAFHCFCDHIITNSVTGQKCTVSKYRIPKSKVDVIYNGKDFVAYQRFDPGRSLKKELGIPKHHRVVTNIARISRQKGQQYFVEAARIIFHQRHFKDVAFLVVGKPEDNYQDVHSLVAKHSLEGCVRFLGVRHDVADILHISDVFVLSSMWEGLPNVILEAMIARVPVVATDIEPNAEIIKNRHTGLLVPAQNGQALADGIQNVLRDRDFANAMAQRGYEEAVDRFGLERLVQEHEAFYADLLKKKSLN